MARKKQIREEGGFFGVTGSGTINYYPKWKTATELEDGYIYYDPIDGYDKFLNSCFFWIDVRVVGTVRANEYCSLGLGYDFIIWNQSVNKDMIFRISDDTGIQKWRWQDSTGKTVFAVDTKGKLEILETGAAPQFYIGIQAGDLSGNYNLTLPTGLPVELLPLLCSNAGVMQFNYVSEQMLLVHNVPTDGYFMRWSAAQGKLIWEVIPNDYVTESMLAINNAPVAGYALGWNAGGFMEWIPVGNISGAGAVGQVSFWTGANTLSGDNDLFWDNVNKILNINGKIGQPTYEARYGFNQNMTITTATGNARGIRCAAIFDDAGDYPGGIDASPTFRPSGNLTRAYGLINYTVADIRSGKTLTLLIGGWYQVTSPATANGVIMSAAAGYFAGGYWLGAKPTNEYGIYVANQGAAGITNAYGVYIEAQSGATNNYDIYCGSGEFWVNGQGYYQAQNNAQFAETCEPDTPNTLAITAGNRHVQPVVVAQKMTLTKFMLSISIAGSGTAWVAIYDVNGNLITSNSFAPTGTTQPWQIALSATLKPGTYYLMFVSNVACTLRGLNKIHANMRERSGTIGTGTPPPASFTPSSITNTQFIPWFHISEV